jgi:hypothetical protein
MRSRVSRRAAGLCALIAQAIVMPATAQSARSLPDYDSVYAELVHLGPVSGQVAQVHDLTLRRDAGEFTLSSGTLVLLSPVNDRTVAVAFHRNGVFHFTPPTHIEQQRLREFKGVTTLAEPFTDLVLVFADSTLAELRRQLTFGEGAPPEQVDDGVKVMLSYLGQADDRSLDPDVLRPLLNREACAMFYAHFSRRGSDPIMFMTDPYETESVRLLVRARHSGYTRRSEVVTQFPAGGDTRPVSPASQRVREARIANYRIETWLPQTMTGDIGFSAVARLDVTSDTTVGPWVAFGLFPKINVDSARWDSSGKAATVFKAKDFDVVWIRLPGMLAPGEHETLTIYYHGDLIDRYGDWFYLKSSVAWYPQQLGWRDVASFDLSFHYPRSMTLAAVGQLTDSATTGATTTTHWVTRHPIRNASFNLGIFDAHPVEHEGTAAVSVLWSEKGHKELVRRLAESGQVVQQRDMEKRVGADVANAMKFFGSVFGPATANQFYATEIPYLHGEAFPGLIHLSYSTFVLTGHDGDDEVFRSHEVAHQWWGIGVDYATYHDQWLSEGLSDFAGLWYMQARLSDNKKYFGMLDRWRSNILARRSDSLPIWLGYRMDTGDPRDNNYNIIVYQKGAWVVNMLRVLLLDLRTMNEDRFGAVMRDFYQQYHGRRATTADFQHVVEQHVGQSMDWFFNQWVYGCSMPTYHVAWHAEPAEGGQYRVQLRVRQEGVPPDFLMYVPVTVQTADNQFARARVKVTGTTSEITLPLMLAAEPRSVEFNDLDGVLADIKMEDW